MIRNYNSLSSGRDTQLKKGIAEFFGSPREYLRQDARDIWLLRMLVLFFVMLTSFSEAQVSTYAYSEASGTYVNLVGGTALVTATANTGAGSLDSFTTAAITLPAGFAFNGAPQTTAFMNSNGFMSFGTTAPATFVSTPISTASVADGIVSPWGSDINTFFNLGSRTGSMSWGTVGTSPNREIVFQWTDFRPSYTTNATNAFGFNFQVRLAEDGKVKIVYGPGSFAIGSTAFSASGRQIGLRGASNTDFNNRVFTSFASASAAGGTNSAGNSFSTATNFPASGLTLTWTPPSCFAPSGLTASLTSQTSANLAWNAASPVPANGYAWEVRSSGLGGSGATGLADSGTTTSAVVTASTAALTANTTYTLYVRSNCGASGFSTWAANSFFTGYCIASGSSSSYYINNFATTGGSTNITNNASGFTTGGYLNATSQAVSNYAGSSVNFSTSYDGSSNTYGFSIFVDWNNDLDFIDTGEKVFGTTSYATSATGSITVPSGQALGNYRMRIVANYNSQTPVSCNTGISGETEDYTFTVSALPSCLPPLALTASPGTTTASLSWTAASPAPSAGYQYEVRTSGIGGSGATGLVTSGTTAAGIVAATASSLTANTSYNFYVRSNCGSGLFSTWTASAVFTTSCASTGIPYTMDFESAVVPAIPACTAVQNVGTGNVWETASAPGYGFASKALRYTYNSTSAANTWFYTQGVSLTAGTSYTITYRYGAAGFSENLKVAYGSSPIASAMTLPIATHAAITTNTAQNSTVSFSPSTTGVYYFGFQAYSLADQFYLLVDDINVSLSPTCIPPTALAATPAFTSAAISWTAPSTLPSQGYEWEVRTSGLGGSGATGLTTSGTTAAGVTNANATSLAQSTTYSLYVRSSCGGADFSTWAGPLSFTTGSITTIPWNEPFANTTLPIGWNQTGWTIGVNTGTGGNPGNAIYKNLWSSAVTGTFTTINVGPVAANQVLTFDYRAANYDSPYAAPAAGSGNFVLAISTNNGATYTDLQTFTNDAVEGWRTSTSSLAAYIGQDIKIRVIATWTSGDYYLAFDNFGVSNLCTGTPVGGTSAVAVQSVCTGLPVQPFTVTGATADAGISYQWEQSTNSGSTWSNAVGGSGATTVAFSPPNFSGVNILYRLKVTCSGSGLFAYSTVSEINSNSNPLPLIQPFTQLNTLGGWTVNGGFGIGTARGATGNPGANAFTNLSTTNTAANLTTAKFGPVTSGQAVSFDMKISNFATPFAYPGNGWGSVDVQVSTDCGLNFTTIGTINSTVQGYNNFKYYLGNYVGQGVSIRLTATWTTGNYDVSIDNFVIDNTAPVISSFTPSTVCSLDTNIISLTGFGFSGASAVTLNGAAVASFTVVSDTSITAMLSQSSTSGVLAVTTALGTGLSTSNVTVIQSPALGAITYDTNVLCKGDTADFDPSAAGGSWSTSDNIIATVDANGIVTAIKGGVATITYSLTDNGCTSSVSQTVTVNEPVASNQPSTANAVVNGNTSFSVTATGTGLSYQWLYSEDDDVYVNVPFSGPFGGVTSATLTITGAPVSLNEYYFKVIITPTAPCSVFESNAAILNVGDVGILTDPSPVTLCSTGNGIAAFTVVPTGSPTAYTWQENQGEGPVTIVNNSTIDGVTYTITNGGKTLTLTGVTLALTGRSYSVIVDGPASSASSIPASLTVNEGIVITNNPTNSSVCSSGGSTSLAVTTTGALGSLVWQYSTTSTGPWNTVVNNTPSGVTYANASTKTLGVTAAAGAAVGIGYYQAIVNGATGCASATSQVASVNITAPTIVISPAAISYCIPGSPVTLTASGAATYSWSPATGLSASTGASVTASPSVTTTYTVTGTDAGGCSATTTVTVSVGNVVTASASSDLATVCPGGNVQLNASGLQSFSTGNIGAYSFAVSNSPYVDVAGGTVFLVNSGGGSLDDGYSSLQNIGFDFSFGGSTFTDFSVNSNGHIKLGGLASTTAYPAISGVPVNIIAFNARDLNNAGAEYKYAVEGASPNRILKIQAKNFYRYNTATHLGNAQVWLYEGSNKVEIHYGAYSNLWTSGAPQIGLKGATTAAANVRSISSLTWASITAASASTSSTSSVTQGTTNQVVSGTVFAFTPGNVPAFTYAWSSSPAGFTSSLANPVASPLVSTTYNVVVTSGSGCSGSASVSVSAVSGAVITTQPVAQVACVGFGASFSVVATGPSLTYQWYKNGSLVSGATASTLSFSNLTSVDAGNYNVVVIPSCGSPLSSSTVALTVNPLPTAVVTSNAPICAAATLNLTATSNAVSFAWSGPNGFTSAVQNPSILNATVAASGVYTLTATSAAGCVTTATLVVNILPFPALVSVTPAASTKCSIDAAQLLTATGGSTTILSENFNNNAPAWTIVNGSASPAVSNFAYTPAPHTDATGSTTFNNFSTIEGGKFALANSDNGGSGSVTDTQLISPTFSTVGFSSASLTFEQVYYSYSGDTTVKLEVSTNGGNTWTQLVDYKGTSVGVTTSGSQSTANSTVSLNAYLNQANLKFRYNYGSAWGFFWLIDNVAVTGTQLPVWTPATGLFTDAAALVPYSGAASATVYAKPTATTTYSATVTSSAGCSTVGTASVTVITATNYYVDSDGDGFGDASENALTYFGCSSAGYVANNGDCNDGVAAINPNVAEVPFNGVDDNCDGTIDEGSRVTTKLLDSSCGTTLASIGSLISIKQVLPLADYTAWRIRATNGTQVQTIERPYGYFTMTLFPSYEYATTYTIEIELQRNGVWLGYYGEPCLVSTPAVLAENGATQISPSQCGITLPTIKTLISTTSLPGATGYRFKVTNLTDPQGPNAVQIVDRPLQFFNLTMLARYNYATTYQVEVAVKTTADYSGYGSPCSVTSPNAPALVDCGGIAATTGSIIAANSLVLGTQYRFLITRLSNGDNTQIDRPLPYFKFNMVPSNLYAAGTVYAVRVAVRTANSWSPFGDICEITSPGAAATRSAEEVVNISDVFKATAYPNPFAATFGIDVTTSSDKMVQLSVYDMLGKLIESKEVNVLELNTVKIGDRYSSGVYNVVVTQGEVVKTLRVIKR